MQFRENLKSAGYILRIGSLENAIGICGGFCAGSHFVVDHQRLSGQGYCFSASLPPMLAAGAQVAVETLAAEDGVRQARLNELSHRLFAALTAPKISTVWRLDPAAQPDSPVMHIRLAVGENSIERLEEVCDFAAQFPVKSGADGLKATPILLTVAR